MENLVFFTQETHGAIAPRLWKIIVLKPLNKEPSNEVAMMILVDGFCLFWSPISEMVYPLVN